MKEVHVPELRLVTDICTDQKLGHSKTNDIFIKKRRLILMHINIKFSKCPVDLSYTTNCLANVDSRKAKQHN